MRVIQTDDEVELLTLAKQLAASKRVAFITGAGISTAAGIPDFRTATTGLFASLKERNPDLKISSGKDLFHSNLFQREETTRAFYQMCAEMRRMANAAPPTEFHLLMKDLDDAGKLFRAYTQNIDSLEAKAGLTFGLGEWQERERLVSKPKAKATKKRMSQKAKGKQRAIDQEPSTDVPANAEEDKFDSLEESHTQAESTSHPTPALDQDVFPLYPEASTSNSPQLVPADHIQSSQTPPNSLLFGSSSQPGQSELEAIQLDLPLRTEQQPHEGKTPTIISPVTSWKELIQTYMSPTRGLVELPSSSSTAVVPDSQEPADQSGDTSTLTSLSNLTDLANASITDIMQMPFCSQGSSVDDETAEGPTPDSSGEISANIADEEAGMEVDQLQEAEQPPLKQITIQRYLTVPRVIPLHGTLDEMHCPKCNHVEPLDKHIDILASGHSIHCPQCLTQDSSRTALGERSRGVGVLKVSVVLYGEEHKQASRVGEIAEKDLLKAARPDILIVAGTTLRIPGVKKLVKELSKVIKQPIREPVKDEQGNPTGEFTERLDPSKRVIFVNRDAPNPEKTWNEIFDTFVQGDAQIFAKLVRQEIEALKNPPPPVQILAPVSTVEMIEPQQQQAAVNLQTSLMDCWSTVGRVTTAAEFMASLQKPSWPSVTGASNAIALPPAVVATPAAPDIRALHSELAKTVKKTVAGKGKGDSDSVDKKSKSGPKKAKAQVLDAKAPTPQAPSGSEGVTAPVVPKKKAQSRKPIKSLAKQLAETKPKPAPTKQDTPKPPKPKAKPGWRGWALVEVDEAPVPKFADHWAVATVEGPRRRRGSSNLPVAASQSQRAAPSMPQPVKEESIREQTPPATEFTAPNAPTSASSERTEQHSDPAEMLSFDFATGRMTSGPTSGQPSVASTPPSLFSDVGTISDNEDARSMKGEDIEAVVSSQGTEVIATSFSAEEEEEDLKEVISSASMQPQSSGCAPVSSAPTMEKEASPADNASSLPPSSQQYHVKQQISQNSRKRPHVYTPTMGTFLSHASIVKHASPVPNKRTKVQN